MVLQTAQMLGRGGVCTASFLNEYAVDTALYLHKSRTPVKQRMQTTALSHESLTLSVGSRNVRGNISRRKLSRGVASKAGKSALGATAAIDWAAIPAWIVKALAERVYAPNPCGEGRYLDPRTQACVYVCRPGYRFDASLRACSRIGLDACEDGYSMKDGRCVPDTACDEGYAYDAALDACVLPQGEFVEPRRSTAQKVVAWLAQRLVTPASQCPIGFYHDPNSNACVPICAVGYVYDGKLKRCIPAQDERVSSRQW